MRRDRAVAVFPDSDYGVGDGFISRLHGIGIGVNESFRIVNQCDMALPEQQIIAVVRGFCRFTQSVLLIAVRRAGDVAGQQGGLNEARAVDAPPAVAAPKVGGPQKQRRNTCWITGSLIGWAQVDEGYEAQSGVGVHLIMTEHSHAAAKAQADLVW